jgi:xylulokinase
VREATKEDKTRKGVKGIGLSTQGGTMTPLDEVGRPLRRAITWLDGRPTKEYQAFAQKMGEDFFYRKMGWRFSPGAIFTQILWLRENEREVFDKTRKFAYVGDYIINRLSGLYCCDPSNGIIGSLYNLHDRCWDRELVELMGIDIDQLSPIMESGTPVGKLTPEAARELNLPQDAIVSSSGHDQYAAALGAGVIDEGDCLLSCGTAWVLLAPSNKLVLDEKKRFFTGEHLIKDRWGILAAMSNGNAVWDWFNEVLSDGGKSRGAEYYEELNQHLSKVPVGSRGLICLPHFIGSRTPTWELSSRGGILGLSHLHSKHDMLRSVMEGIVLETRWGAEAMLEMGVAVTHFTMIGGAARSPIWAEIAADATKREITLPENTEAACTGAAILAGVGCGIFSDPREGYRRMKGPERKIEPSPGKAAAYDELFAIYKDAFWSLREPFKRLGKIVSE